jgi:hypothetical protein
MRTINYVEKLDLGEEDGMENVLVKTAREVHDLPPDQRPWATLKDIAKVLGVPIPTVYQWVYNESIPYRRFKKNPSDRIGITLLPVREVMEFAQAKQSYRRRNRYVYPVVKGIQANLGKISEAGIQEQLTELLLDLHDIIDKQAATIGRWPSVEIFRAYKKLKEETTMEGQHEQTQV